MFDSKFDNEWCSIKEEEDLIMRCFIDKLDPLLDEAIVRTTRVRYSTSVSVKILCKLWWMDQKSSKRILYFTLQKSMGTDTLL